MGDADTAARHRPVVLLTGNGGISGRSSDDGNGSGGLNTEPDGGGSGGGVGLVGPTDEGGPTGTVGGGWFKPCGRTWLGLTQSRRSATGAVLHPAANNKMIANTRFMRRSI
jgi:hypothetical protein